MSSLTPEADLYGSSYTLNSDFGDVIDLCPSAATYTLDNYTGKIYNSSGKTIYVTFTGATGTVVIGTDEKYTISITSGSVNTDNADGYINA